MRAAASAAPHDCQRLLVQLRIGGGDDDSAVLGGAAESGSAIAMARQNKLDLTIGIAMGSSIQIALFVAPVLVLASGWVAPQPLELSFSRAEIGTLFLAVLIAAIVSGDGRSNWYKGAQLMLVYAMIASLFDFLPAPAH